MIDRFVTGSRLTIQDACEALQKRTIFAVDVPRDDAIQHWRGYVTKLEAYGDDVRIEVNRVDI